MESSLHKEGEMPSSISNSNDITRVVPNHHWFPIALMVLITTTMLTLGWELYWRNQGYEPGLDDNKDLWAQTREKVSKKGTVIIGASRILFGFDLSEYEKRFGKKPLQLATVGTNPTFYLHDIANHTEFAGTLIVGVTPMLWYVPEGMPVETPTKNIEYFNRWSLAQKINHSLDQPLQKIFAFLNSEDLPLKKLMDHKIPNRVGAAIPPRIPPYFMKIDKNRQGQMIEKMETNIEFQNFVRNIWIPLFTPPPPPPQFTPEQFMEMFKGLMAKVRGEVAASVAKIQKRGGKVIFIRYPSSGKVRELENKFGPRPGFYGPLVAEAQPDLSIHFEDYPELSDYELPEWSHLTKKDATEFTQKILAMMKDKGF